MNLKTIVIGSLLVVSSTVFAQWQPTKPIEAIMAWTPGSVNELSFRVLAKEVEKNTGAKFIIINRPGAGGVIGTEELSKKPADGYSVTNVSVPGIAAMDKVQVQGAGRSYTTDSFVYPTHIASSPFVIASHPNDPAKTPKQFLDSLKNDKVSIAASGGARLVYEGISARVKFPEGKDGVVRVDHKGPVDALVDVASGNVRYAIVPSLVANALYKDGRINIIALSAPPPMRQFPGIPLLDTALPNFNITGMWALMLPAGTPNDVVEWYTREFTKAMKSDEAKAIFYDNLLLERTDLQNPKSMAEWVKSREKQWQPLVDTVLIKNNQK
jgi:tripartite-type tricarboxylate transporter receptor subunit TctC